VAIILAILVALAELVLMRQHLLLEQLCMSALVVVEVLLLVLAEQQETAQVATVARLPVRVLTQPQPTMVVAVVAVP
jgi:hypothetical protein